MIREDERSRIAEMVSAICMNLPRSRWAAGSIYLLRKYLIRRFWVSLPKLVDGDKFVAARF